MVAATYWTKSANVVPVSLRLCAVAVCRPLLLAFKVFYSSFFFFFFCGLGLGLNSSLLDYSVITSVDIFLTIFIKNKGKNIKYNMVGFYPISFENSK